LLFIGDTVIVAVQLVDFYDSQRLMVRGLESDFWRCFCSSPTLTSLTRTTNWKSKL